jgi:16S rRNA U1498 N3-methylase RsmE
MALSRIFVSDNLSAGQQLHLGGDRARYIGRALRLRVGDSISVFPNRT